MLPRLPFREEVSEKIWGHDDLEAARKEGKRRAEAKRFPNCLLIFNRLSTPSSPERLSSR